MWVHRILYTSIILSSQNEFRKFQLDTRTVKRTCKLIYKYDDDACYKVYYFDAFNSLMIRMNEVDNAIHNKTAHRNKQHTHTHTDISKIEIVTNQFKFNGIILHQLDVTNDTPNILTFSLAVYCIALHEIKPQHRMWNSVNSIYANLYIQFE